MFSFCCVLSCGFFWLPCINSYVILSSVQLMYGEKQIRRIIVSKLGLHQCLCSSNVFILLCTVMWVVFLLLPCINSYVILSSVQLIYGEKQCRRIIVSKLGLHQCLCSSNSRPMYSSFSTFSSQPTCFM